MLLMLLMLLMLSIVFERLKSLGEKMRPLSFAAIFSSRAKSGDTLTRFHNTQDVKDVNCFQVFFGSSKIFIFFWCLPFYLSTFLVVKRDKLSMNFRKLSILSLNDAIEIHKSDISNKFTIKNLHKEHLIIQNEPKIPNI